MTIRYNSGDPNGVPSGYQSPDVPTDINIPSCGIEDVDESLFKLFDKEIKFSVRDNKTGNTKNVPVVFATGERWALIKKGAPLRDTSNTIILPLTTIRRIALVQDIKEDITGRGINQQTGELVIKRRLSQRDRSYQNLINKLGIPNQENIANSLDESGFTTDRDQELNMNDPEIRDGGLLTPKLEKNIWEVITIPSPQFFTAKYEVTFWTQYTTHMNQLIQQLMSAYLPQGNAFRLDTEKGYWFVATIEGNEYRPEDNSEDFGLEERLIKYSFTMTVPGYYIAGDTANGTPSATRRYISSPLITFQIGSDDGELLANGVPSDEADEHFAFADDPSNPFLLNPITNNQNFRTPSSQETNYIVQTVADPFGKGKKNSYLRVVTVNSKTGETVYRTDNSLIFKIT